MSNWYSFLLLLVASVSVTATTSRKTKNWMSRLKDEQAVLLARLDKEERLLAETKELVAKEQPAREKELNALRQEVMLLEAKNYAHKEKLKQVQDDAANANKILQGLLDEARRMTDDTTRKAEEDSRRVCEVLTNDRPDLKPLCHKMSEQPDPEMLKVIDLLYKKATTKNHGNPHAITLQGLLTQLIVLWLAWLLLSWTLLRPLFNTKTPRSRLCSNKRISPSKRKVD